MADDATPPAVSDLPEAPDTGKPLSFDEAADSIAELIDDAPAAKPDHKADGPDDAEDAPEPSEPEPDPLGDDDEAEGEDVETQDAAEQEDGPQGAGQYVSPKAKYKLADGTEITVGELARNNLFQRDYSQKTEALKRESDTVKAKSEQVDQLAKTLQDERQFVIWFAEQHAPKPPQPPTDPNDPLAEIEYARKAREYQVYVESWRQFKAGQDADAQRKAGETQQQAKVRAGREVKALFDAVKIDPAKDQAKAKSFVDALGKGAKEHFGISKQELANVLKLDHRYGLVLREAIRSKQNKAAVPAVQEKLKAVPKMVRAPTARTAPSQQASRAVKAAGERASRTGRQEDLADFLSLIPDL